jgi:hypothetical protein
MPVGCQWVDKSGPDFHICCDAADWSVFGANPCWDISGFGQNAWGCCWPAFIGYCLNYILCPLAKDVECPNVGSDVIIVRLRISDTICNKASLCSTNINCQTIDVKSCVSCRSIQLMAVVEVSSIVLIDHILDTSRPALNCCLVDAPMSVQGDLKDIVFPDLSCRRHSKF